MIITKMIMTYDERRTEALRLTQEKQENVIRDKLRVMLRNAPNVPKNAKLPEVSILPTPHTSVPEEPSMSGFDLETYFHCEDFDKPMPCELIKETHAATVSRYYFDLKSVRKHWKNRKDYFEALDREFKENIGIVTDRDKLGEKGHFAVEVVRKQSQRKRVHFKDAVEKAFASGSKPFDFIVGEDLENNIVTSNLKKAKSMLVAGTSGSGKSKWIKSMLASLMMSTSPDDLQIHLADFKGNELNAFEEAPHVRLNMITCADDLLTLIESQIMLMNARYDEMREHGLVDVAPHMTRQLIVIEEMAECVMSIPEKDRNKKLFEPLARILQKGRAAGFHVIIATQKPTIDIIGKQVNPNIQTRIGLKTASGNESKIVIDETGLEKLGGYGDMLARIDGNPSLQRMQSPFIENTDIKEIVEYWNGQTA